MNTGNKKDEIVGLKDFSPVGQQQVEIPFDKKLSAQIILSRENGDVVLAQKATDMLLQELVKDPKSEYLGILPQTISNEIEVLTFFCESKKEEITTDYEDEVMEKISDGIKRIVKNLKKYDFEDSGGLVSKAVSSLIKASLACRALNIRDCGVDEIIETINDSDMLLFVAERDMEEVNKSLWDFLLKSSIICNLTHCYLPFFRDGDFYSSPIEMEFDPDHISLQIYFEQLRFLHRGISSDLISKAVVESGRFRKFDIMITEFVTSKLDDEHEASDLDDVVKDLQVLFLDFVFGKVVDCKKVEKSLVALRARIKKAAN